MIEVRDMDRKGVAALLREVGYGHLACCRANVPYVVPIQYAYLLPYVYIYTTDGKKVEIITENPEVCLQVEKILSNESWQSVIINGRASIVTDPQEREKALRAIRKNNPTLTPALSVRWMDNWVRDNREIVYRIEPYRKTGRHTHPASATLYAGAAKPGEDARVL